MKLIIALLTFASVAHAHIEEGKHAGHTPDGQACELTAGEAFFENNLPHPLNERIKVTVNGTEFVIHHPPVIDASTKTVFFNHNAFESVVATDVGAKSLVVDMIHTTTKEGPTGFTYIENNWKTGAKSMLVCTLD